MADTPYTLADLEKARAALDAVNERFASYSGNNPDKYQSQIKAAERDVRAIKAALKMDGTLPLTDQEKLERELDAAFPKAQSKEVVQYKGKKYQRWFYPAEKSNSGRTVHGWDKGWKEIPG